MPDSEKKEEESAESREEKKEQVRVYFQARPQYYKIYLGKTEGRRG